MAKSTVTPGTPRTRSPRALRKAIPTATLAQVPPGAARAVPAASATERRPAGLLEAALNTLPRSKWTGASSELASAWLACPRVRNIGRRHAHYSGCDFDDLLQAAWMLFAEKLFAKLDKPANVYSLLYKTMENCALTLRNAQREVSLDVQDDDASADLVDRLSDESSIETGAPGGEYTNTVEVDIDHQRFRDAFAAKIQRLGWPSEIPKQDTSYRRAGRPLGVRNKIDPYNAKKVTGQPAMKTELSPYLTPGKPRAGKHPVTQEIERKLDEALQPAEPEIRHLQPVARKIAEIRQELGMTNRSFAKALDSSLSIVSATITGNVYRDEQAKALLARAQALRADLLKRRDTSFLITNDMRTIIENWRKRLKIKSAPERVAREIAIRCSASSPDDNGKLSESTMYRWWQENRKPADLDTLINIHHQVLSLEKQAKPV